MTWPAGKNNEYIPFAEPVDRVPLTIKDLQERGTIASVSEDGTRATVQISQGLMVSFVGVSLLPDGTIGDFLRKTLNKYVKVDPSEVKKTNFAALWDAPSTEGDSK